MRDKRSDDDRRNLGLSGSSWNPKESIRIGLIVGWQRDNFKLVVKASLSV